MQDKPRCAERFFDWLDTLSDEEHHVMLLQLRAAATELGCRVNRHSLATHQLLDLPSHNPSVTSLN